MKVPKSGPEISEKWVDHILREHKTATNSPALLHIDNYTVSKDLGDGYNSQVVFFSVETTEKNEDSSSDRKQTYHLVAKLPKQDPQSRALNKKFKATLKEYLIYTDLINNLNKILSVKVPEEPQISLPKLIYGKHTSNEFVLVMENLQYAGYEMNDKREGLNGEQLKAAMENIARIHAVSYVFHKTTDTSKYSCFPAVFEYIDIFTVLMKAMLNNCVTFLKSSEETEEIGKKVELSASSLLEKSSVILMDPFVMCLIHGDFWNNNFMFKYNEAPNGQRIIEEVKIIDWGNCCWGNPLFDLQYLVYTSTKRDIRRDHLNEALSHYHSTFTKLTTQLGFPLSNWSLTELKAEWEKLYPIGFIMGCMLTQGTLSTTNPANKTPEPSVLDKPFLSPLKALVDGMKFGVAKVLVPLSLSSGGKKLMEGLMKKIMKPIFEELKSGKNEAMNTRLLELFYEADENGLFSA